MQMSHEEDFHDFDNLYVKYECFEYKRYTATLFLSYQLFPGLITWIISTEEVLLSMDQ